MVKNEFDALKEVNEALSQIDEEARGRVLDWIYSKYKVTKPSINPLGDEAEKPQIKGTKSVTPKTKTGKSKVVLKQVKDLNLYPKGKKSIKEFVDEKRPSSMEQKAVVAIYYLIGILEVSKVTIEHVYTVFKTVNWIMPANLKNALHRAGSMGWLDTAESGDIKVTSSGENLVEHHLPTTKKEKGK